VDKFIQLHDCAFRAYDVRSVQSYKDNGGPYSDYPKGTEVVRIVLLPKGAGTITVITTAAIELVYKLLTEAGCKFFDGVKE